jgi:toxin ParE1/3/4
MRVIWSARAITDLLTIRSYIRQNNPDAAQRIALEIRTAALSLPRFPYRGIARPDGTRELIASRYPYILQYDVSESAIEILAIWHGAQNRG